MNGGEEAQEVEVKKLEEQPAPKRSKVRSSAKVEAAATAAGGTSASHSILAMFSRQRETQQKAPSVVVAPSAPLPAPLPPPPSPPAEQLAELEAELEKIDGIQLVSMIVGGHHHDGELLGSSQGDALSQQELTVEREAGNPRDANALRVLNGEGEAIGHVPARLAGLLSPLVDARLIRLSLNSAFRGKVGDHSMPLPIVLTVHVEHVGASVRELVASEPHLQSDLQRIKHESERSLQQGPLTLEQHLHRHVHYLARVVSTTRSTASHLFLADELAITDHFRSWPEHAQRLVARLVLSRSDPSRWFDVTKLKYAEVPDVASAVAALCATNAAMSTADPARLSYADLEGLIAAATAPVLREFAVNVGLQQASSRRSSVADLRRLLVRRLAKQRTMKGERLVDSLQARVVLVQSMGDFFRLNSGLVSVLQRMLRLFFVGDRSENVASARLLIMQGIDMVRFFPYSIGSSSGGSSSGGSSSSSSSFSSNSDAAHIFTVRQELLDYEAALGVLRELGQAAPEQAGGARTQQGTRSRPELDFDGVVACVRQATAGLGFDALGEDLEREDADLRDSVVERFVQPLQSVPHVGGGVPSSPHARLQLHFRAGSVYASVCHYAVAALERQKLHAVAVALLAQLLARPFRYYRRGYWWTRLALNLERHLKTSRGAMQVCRLALTDPCVRTGDLVQLRKRAVRLYKARPSGPRPVAPELMRQTNLISSMVKHVTYRGRPTNRVVGQKSHFFGFDNQMCSVEELALQFYAKDGWEGMHCENALINTLFGLLCWDAIFAPGVPGAFLTPFQSAPLDLDTDSFYAAREEILQPLLRAIREADDAELCKRLAAAWRWKGYSCVGVNWDRWRLAELQRYASCIGGYTLAGVCESLAADHRSWMGGLPDLFLWHPSTRRAKLVEVKGPRDRLSDQQEAWLYRFGELLVVTRGSQRWKAVEVEVCHIKES